jgi:large repetitive protein
MRAARALVVLMVLASTFVGLPNAEAQTCSNPTINPPDNTALPDGEKGVAYSTSITVSGGSGHYFFQFTGGALPPGLDWSPKGHGTGTLTISGTPTSMGKSNFTFAIYDWPNYPSGLNCTGVPARYTIDIPYADLSVSQSAAPDPPTPGEDMAVDVTITNFGFNPATDVTLTETLPEGVEANSATWTVGGGGASGSCSLGNQVVCSVGTLSNGQYDYANTAAVHIVITASSGAMSFTAEVASAIWDPDETNNSTELSLASAESADLEVGIINTETSKIFEGDAVILKVKVTNKGPQPAQDVIAQMSLHGVRVGLINTSQGSCTKGNDVSGANPLCTIGSMSSGAVERILITVRFRDSGPQAQGADVSSSTPDSITDNNLDGINIDVQPSADLVVRLQRTVADGGTKLVALVKNLGPSPSPKQRLTIFFRGGQQANLQTNPGDCSLHGDGFECRWDGMASGASDKFVFLLKKHFDGEQKIVAEVRGPTHDPKSGNNRDTMVYDPI